MEEERREDHD